MFHPLLLAGGGLPWEGGAFGLSWLQGIGCACEQSPGGPPSASWGGEGERLPLLGGDLRYLGGERPRRLGGLGGLRTQGGSEGVLMEHQGLGLSPDGKVGLEGMAAALKDSCIWSSLHLGCKGG